MKALLVSSAFGLLVSLVSAGAAFACAEPTEWVSPEQLEAFQRGEDIVVHNFIEQDAEVFRDRPTQLTMIEADVTPEEDQIAVATQTLILDAALPLNFQTWSDALNAKLTFSDADYWSSLDFESRMRAEGKVPAYFDCSLHFIGTDNG